MAAQDQKATTGNSGTKSPSEHRIQAPSISLPRGGGAIKGIGEKFAANPVTGTGSLSVPVAASPGRSGFGPQLSLSYDSGAGNGPFGLGWNLSLPAITRKTDKGLPKYNDAAESDVFILSGAEDLMPLLVDKEGGRWLPEPLRTESLEGRTYAIRRYRPRTEGLFVRIERWANRDDPADVRWRSITKDNVTSWYGKNDSSRIFDPARPCRIFSWLIHESYDDRGNWILYEYVAEDSAGVDGTRAHEKNRTDESRSANRYIKRIKYGNRATRLVPIDPIGADWMFEVLFDYGEGHYADHTVDAQGREFVQASLHAPHSWPVRMDPFSGYRSGFEVRAYRLCRRVLMFHHFPEELGIDDYLVRSTEIEYLPGPVASYVKSITQSGYTFKEGMGFLKRSLPPLEFSYTTIPGADDLAGRPVEKIDMQDLENMPQGLDGYAYQMMDLDGTGLPDIVTEQGGAVWRKPNLSPMPVVENDERVTRARFGPLADAGMLPAGGILRAGRQLLDLAGDGQPDLVEFGGATPGFWENDPAEGWRSHRTFTSLPVIDWSNPHLKFADLNGDGHADIFLTEDHAFAWHPSLGEEGFGEKKTIAQPRDEEKGPALVFADATQSVYLADLSGDGLTDLVRIRNGEVCYWPNLGYGNFGPKITMDNSPWFDRADQFDQKRIRLADTDGSGTTDILYLGRDGVRVYFNQSGNSFSDPAILPQFSAVDNSASLQTADLLGNGTACLVWSTPLPGREPIKYVRLMEEKPHLLTTVINNLGAETAIIYAPSTRFFLQDKYQGKPWITRLPFPVHVVERVETYDRISRNRFVTRYAYHHGYFDGPEREFRGFCMVEQWDTAEYGAQQPEGCMPQGDTFQGASQVPPILTKTWYHTGAFLKGEEISRHMAYEYHGAPREDDPQFESKWKAFEKTLLPDTILPDGLPLDEEQEACRSLRGSMLRQEVYAIDGSDKEKHPYTVTEQNFSVRRLQPRGGNPHAVFFTHARETVRYHYERNPSDPRVAHQLTLTVDGFGNVERSVAIGYPRRNGAPRQPEQADTHMTLTVSRFANRGDEPDWYRAGMPIESRTYEIVKPPEPEATAESVDLFCFETIKNLTESLFPLPSDPLAPGAWEPDPSQTMPYEQWDRRPSAPQPAASTLRLIERVRTLYRKNDMSALNAPGDVESMALPGESYTLSLTSALRQQLYRRDGLPLADAVEWNILRNEGGYADLDGDGNWWIPSGRIYYEPDKNNENRHAIDHFFLPLRFEDPFGNAVKIRYDNHNLLPLETKDALNNQVQSRNNYRVLQPELVTDPNGNRVESAFDALGLVAGTAVMGKAGEFLGDLLDDSFEPDLSLSQLDGFFNADHPARDAAPALLGSASTRIIYDVSRYYRTGDPGRPACAAALARETHCFPRRSGDTRIQVSFSFSDGYGREIQKKVPAEKGTVPKRGIGGDLMLINGEPDFTDHEVEPRWVGSGWTVFNNKGKPVRQFEPFFTDRHDFEFDVRIGVSSILFYDPAERVVAALHPNHTYEKTVFDPWEQEQWDVNDTVLLNPCLDADVQGFFTRPDGTPLLPDDEYLPTWYSQRIGGAMGNWEKDAAEKTAQHAGTPGRLYLDSLGRTFLA
ncbi:MAG: VCBS repeat-containing protein, partial [Chitinispirillaceae bacterium]|nr:VCBS repeat-containing protein [Chitinispirillaceae bacterium]